MSNQIEPEDNDFLLSIALGISDCFAGKVCNGRFGTLVRPNSVVFEGLGDSHTMKSIANKCNLFEFKEVNGGMYFICTVETLDKVIPAMLQAVLIRQSMSTSPSIEG